MAKPKLALIPAAQGSRFYSVLPSSGIGDFSFTRNTSATRINKDGYIESVPALTSRLNYPLIDGVVKGCPHHILEPQRINYVPYSEEFINSGWDKISGGTGSTPIVTADYSISPSGVLDATRIQFDKGAGTGFNNYSLLAEVLSVPSGIDTSKSIYLKSNTNSEYDLVLYGTSDASGTNVKKIRITTEWQRFDVFKTITGTVTGIAFGLREINVSGLSNTADILAWGAQVENGLYPTSYIPTSSGTATRSAETANGAGDASTFNDSEGVLMAEISALADLDDTRYIALNAGTNIVNSLLIQYRNSGELRLYNGGTSTAQMIYRDTSLDLSKNIKISIKYGTTSSSYKVYINGFSKTIESAFVATSMSGLDNLKFTDINGSSSPFYGKTKQIQYFDTTADIDLETLTSWVSFQDMAEGQQYSIK